MASPSFSSILRHKLAAGAAVAAVLATVVTGVWVTSAQASTTSSTTSTSSTATHAKSTKAQLEKLKADLQAARKLDGDARKAALVKIRKDEKAGVYGPGVERRVDRRVGDRKAFRALLPADLKADVAKVRKADPADRKAMRQDIEKKALAGDYGTKVEKAAKALQDRFSALAG